MKNITKLLNLLTAFLAIIGICAASLVFFIVAYTQINGGFSPQHTTNQKVIVTQTSNNIIEPFSFGTDSNDNPTSASLSDADTLNNYNNIEPISWVESQATSKISEQPDFEYDTNLTTIEADYAANIKTSNASDPKTYAMPIEQETSSALPTEQEDSNVTYSYEVPIKNSAQIANNSIATENGNNLNTYSTPELQASELITDTVWLSETGEKYHSINHCGRMNPDKARQVSFEYAITAGYGKCQNCF